MAQSKAPTAAMSKLHRYTADFGLPMCSLTCVHAVSDKVALGTSQGTVHVVERSITEFGLHRGERLASIVPDGGRNSIGSDWSVSSVRIAEGSASEYVAFATASGMVAVYCLRRESTRKVHSWRAGPAKNNSVACLVWDRQGRYLFSADASGVVMCHDCEALTSHQVAALGTEVAQVDVGVLDHELTLLVSTRDRCVRIQRPEVEGGAQLQQVGTKLRDVPLGACFYRPSDDLVARIPGGGPQPSGGSAATACCVRPGRRLWLADASTGLVRSTLRFSAPFEAAAFATGGNDKLFTSRTKPSFGCILPAVFRPQTVKADGGGDSAAGVQMPLLVSWDANSLHVLDPAAILESGGITEWHVDLGQIVSLSVCPAFPCPTAKAKAPSPCADALGDAVQFSVVYVLHRRAQDAIPIVSVISPFDMIATQAMAIKFEEADRTTASEPVAIPYSPEAATPRAAGAGAGAGAGGEHKPHVADDLASAIAAASNIHDAGAPSPPVVGEGAPSGRTQRWGSAESADAGAGRCVRRASFVEADDELDQGDRERKAAGTGGGVPTTGLSAEVVQAQHRQRLAQRAAAAAAPGAAPAFPPLTKSSTALSLGLHEGRGRAGMQRSGSVWSVSSSPPVLLSSPETVSYNQVVGHVHEFPLKNPQGKTLYEIHMMVYLGPSAGVCACSNRTLEEFLQLAATLRRRHATNFKFKLPKPTWFGNNKPSTIRYRAMRLDKFVKHALQIPAVVRHPAFVEFVGLKRALGVEDAEGSPMLRQRKSSIASAGGPRRKTRAKKVKGTAHRNSK